MKIYLKLLVLILVLGLAAPFFLQRPDGRAWMEAGSFLPDTAVLWQKLQQSWHQLASRRDDADKPAILPAGHSDGLSDGQRQVYKWRTADGSWAYSDRPPGEETGVEIHTVVVDPDTNVIQAIDLPAAQQKAAQKAVATPADRLPLPLTVPPAEIKSLLQDARDVQRQSEKRLELLQK